MLLTTSVIRLWRQAFPETRLDVLGREESLPLLLSFPGVHACIADRPDLRFDVPPPGYDRVLVLDNLSNLPDVPVSRPDAWVHAVPSPSWWHRALGLRPRLPEGHMRIRLWLRFLSDYALPSEPIAPEYYLEESHGIKITDLPLSHQMGYMALELSRDMNGLPVRQLEGLCRSLDYPVILLGDPTFQDEAQAVCRIDSFRIYNACGKFNERETMDLIRRARLFVGGYTLRMRLAAVLGVSRFIVFRGTKPEPDATDYRKLDTLGRPLEEWMPVRQALQSSRFASRVLARLRS